MLELVRNEVDRRCAKGACKGRFFRKPRPDRVPRGDYFLVAMSSDEFVRTHEFTGVEIKHFRDRRILHGDRTREGIEGYVAS